MNIVLSETKCPSCGSRLIRTPDVGGDYYETVIGFTLQQYCNQDCNQNGVLRPELDGHDPNFISNRGKIAFGIRIARAFRKNFRETKMIMRSIGSNNLDEVVSLVSSLMKIPKSKVLYFSG